MSNQFKAKVTFKDNKEAQNFVKAFFENFNFESCVKLKGNTAEMIICFREELPDAIIKSITNIPDLEFYYNEDLLEKIKETKIYKSETSLRKQIKNANEQQKSSANLELATEKPKNVKTTVKTRKGKRRTTSSNKDVVKAKVQSDFDKMLENILKQSKSFEDFVELLAKYLKLKGVALKKFKKLAICSTEMEKINWKELDKKYKTFSRDRETIGHQISIQFKTEMTLLAFLKSISKFKTYPFPQEDISKKEESDANKKMVIAEKLQDSKKDEEQPNNQETHKESESTQKDPQEFELVEQSKILELNCFKEIFTKVNKIQPIQARIQFVLKSMGLDERQQEEKDWILEIANNAIKQKNLDNSFNSKNNIPKEQKELAQMVFSEFVNTFLNKREGNKMIKLVDFLKEFQKNILTDIEKEQLVD